MFKFAPPLISDTATQSDCVFKSYRTHEIALLNELELELELLKELELELELLKELELEELELPRISSLSWT
jgi:hypothetical protein